MGDRPQLAPISSLCCRSSTDVNESPDRRTSMIRIRRRSFFGEPYGLPDDPVENLVRVEALADRLGRPSRSLRAGAKTPCFSSQFPFPRESECEHQARLSQRDPPP